MKNYFNNLVNDFIGWAEEYPTSFRFIMFIFLLINLSNVILAVTTFTVILGIIGTLCCGYALLIHEKT